MKKISEQTDILNIKLKLGGKTYQSKLYKELSIGSNINEDIIKQPGTFAWYAVLMSLAKKFFDEKKSEKKQTYAKLDKFYRGEEGRLDRITDKSVDQAIERDKKYIASCQEVIEAEFNYNLMYSAVESFKQKKDMLVTLASNMRAEYGSNMTILTNETKKVIKDGKSKNKK